MDDYDKAREVIERRTFPSRIIHEIIAIEWEKVFFTILGMSEVPDDVQARLPPVDVVGLWNQFWFTTTIFPETD